jgi:shikimate kinase
MSEGQNFQLKRTVVLVGMMGSGKTAIGRALSLRLEVPFVDSDVAIEEAAAASIPEIFAKCWRDCYQVHHGLYQRAVARSWQRAIATSSLPKG